MKYSYHMYLLEPASRRFKSFSENIRLEEVFNYLSDSKHVEVMIGASQEKRPAMEAVIEDIEARFLDSIDFDLEFNYRHRQVLGSMIRYIMGHYGYWPGKAVKLKKGNFVKTAIVYSR